MSEPLSDVEVRILGSLVEKQLTTPEYYPLTLNALIAACNQKSNRDPVVNYDETTILKAIDSLRDKNLVYLFYGSGSRTVKYKHMLPSVFELEPPETAVLAVLMLRGPQTPGELRERTGRLHEFSGTGEVQDTLDQLARRDEPLVRKLERRPGQKEARFAHRLSGDLSYESTAPTDVDRQAIGSSGASRIETLQQELDALRSEVAALKEMFEKFRKQFE